MMDTQPGSSFPTDPQGGSGYGPDPASMNPGMASSTPSPTLPTGRTQKRMWLIAGGIGVAGLGVIGAIVFALALKSGPGIDRMIPDSANLYGTIALDPSVTQKANLLALAHRFPDLGSQQDLQRKLDDELDKAMKDTGLSFTKDVQPWLGSRVSVVVTLGDKPHGAWLIDSKDDKKAQATLDTARTSTAGKKLTWSQRSYNGVTVWVGTDATTTDVYAYLDHTAVLGDSESLLHDIIDTDHGKHASLLANADYQATIALLPSDRLGLVYAGGHGLIDALKAQAGKSQSLTIPASTWDQLYALRGVAFSVAASDNGLSGDLEVKIDPTKLDATTRAALSGATRVNALMQWIPERTMGLFATTSLKASVKSVTDNQNLDDQTRQALDALGITAIYPHLTGDLAVEVETTLPGRVGGALLIGSNSDADMKFFLTKLVTVAELAASESGSFSGSTQVTKRFYRGIEIDSLPVPELQSVGITPTYSVDSGVGIIATSPQEVINLINAHLGGRTIEQSANFRAANKFTVGNPQALFYIDVTETTNAIVSYLPAADRQQYETQAAKDLTPIKAVIVTSSGDSQRITERFFVLIPS
jgi:hypothetical protein